MSSGDVAVQRLEQQTASLALDSSSSSSTSGTPKGRYVPPHRRAAEEAASVAPPQRDFVREFPRDTGYSSRSNGYNNRGGDRDDRRSGNGEQASFFSRDRGNDRQPEDRRGPSSRRDDRPQGNEMGPRNMELERELFAAKPAGINFNNYDGIPVEVNGDNVPEAFTTFAEANPPLHENLLANINLAHFDKPTPVQRYGLPIGVAGRDLMACAQTGSGKTGAFLFPIINNLLVRGPVPPPSSMEDGGRRRKTYPDALILAPTRELAVQIFDEARKFTYRSYVRPTVVYGGAEMYGQLRELERGCNLLVATPGRLVDIMERGRVSLARVRFLVLDEADRMLDMGFEPQIRQIVQHSDMPVEGDRQTLMFSATFPSEIQRLAKEFLSDYIFLTVGRVGATSENIEQRIMLVEEKEKQDALLDILSNTASGLTLIFVETKRNADYLDEFLYNQGFLSSAIHGDRDQRSREEALRAFRSNERPFLVATAVAARGLDIPSVTHVVNYDLPSDVDDYVHRIGRTGRAGHKGVATSFFNRSNAGIAGQLATLLRDAGQEVPPFLDGMTRDSFGSRGGSRGGRGGAGFGSPRGNAPQPRGGAAFNERNGGFGARDVRSVGPSGSVPSSPMSGGGSVTSSTATSPANSVPASPAKGSNKQQQPQPQQQAAPSSLPFMPPSSSGGNYADAWDS